MAENNNMNACCVLGCVGYAYVPVQVLYDTFEPCEALQRGTVFPELELTICEYGKLCKGMGGVANG